MKRGKMDEKRAWNEVNRIGKKKVKRRLEMREKIILGRLIIKQIKIKLRKKMNE